MEIKILEKNEKILLSREEIKAQVSFTDTVPSKESVIKSLASQLKADEKLLVVKIFPKFKRSVADVLAYRYLNKDDMKRIEPKDKKAEKAAEAKKKEASEEGK